MGKILLVVSDKGGVGKSTYVANTGSMLVNKGKSVIILKTDKNHDLLSWNEKRTDNGLLTIPVHAAYGNVSNEIKRLSKLCEVLIVDCPASTTLPDGYTLNNYYPECEGLIHTLTTFMLFRLCSIRFTDSENERQITL